MQIHSGGLLRATMHCVKGAAGPASADVTRHSFAVFMQPRRASLYPETRLYLLIQAFSPHGSMLAAGLGNALLELFPENPEPRGSFSSCWQC